MGGRGALISKDQRKYTLELINEAVSNGARKSEVCKFIGISLRTIQRWLKQGLIDKRKGAEKVVKNSLSDSEKKEIIRISCSDRFKNMTPYTIVSILAEEGIYVASESSFYKVLREENLLKHRRNTRKPRDVEKIEVKATAPNQIWSWDISYLKTNIKGKFYYLYLFMDVYSRLITGWEVYENESGENASNMMSNICNNHNIDKDKLILHSDNGSPMKSATMLATLDKLGVAPSYSRPSVSNDNAYSESLFKTLKYTAGYPKCFKSIEEAREWMTKFVSWYNNEHRHSKIGYVTPMQKYTGKDKEIMAKRQKTYEEAKKKNPERWSKGTKKWKVVEEIFLKKGNYKKTA